MNNFNSGKFIGKTAGLLFTGLVVFAIFQNCAQVVFTNQGSQTPSVAQYEPQYTEDFALEGGTHGDGYDGKVTRYLHWSERGECLPDEVSIKSEIHKYQDHANFFVVQENCELTPVLEVTSDEIVLTPNGLIYQGKDFQNTYPKSCAEIYDRGGDPDSGFYEIDPDGDGPQPVDSIYCDMALTAEGWGPWSDWTPCDVTCGEGEQSRHRNCNTLSCDGSESETRLCQLESCP